MFEVAIIGGGLAGFALAEALIEGGMSPGEVCLLEASAPAAGCSGGVGAMLNPLPGRSLDPKPGYPQAFAYSCQWLQRQLDFGTQPFCLRLPVVRPLIEALGAAQMKKSYLRGRGNYVDFLESELLSAEEATEQYPLLAPTEGAIVFRPGFTLDFGDLVRQLAQRLDEQGLVCALDGPVAQACHREGAWVCRTASQEWRARRLVFAVGAGLDEWFPSLPMQMTGGELAIFAPPAGLELNGLMSAAGYVVPRWDGNWTVGATFWHGRKDSDFSEVEIFERLTQKGSRLIPALRDATPLSTWFGVRAIYRTDRQPIVGAIPGLPQCYLMGAFASKGLLWIPWMAHSLAQKLLGSEEEIHAAASIRRVKEKLFVPNDERIVVRGA